MSRIPENLIRDLRDEDTEVWIEAAVKIGRMGRQAAGFLAAGLRDTSNLHLWRHCWAAYAAYLDTMEPGTDVAFRIPKDSFFVKGKGPDFPEVDADRLRELLCFLIATGLRETTIPLRELRHSLPAFEAVARFLKVRIKGDIEKKEKALATEGQDDAKRTPIRRELDRVRAELDALRLGDTPLCRFKRRLNLKLRPWVIGSFLGGGSADLVGYLQIPLHLLVGALARLAAPGGDAIAFVAGLPRLLRDLPTRDPQEVDFAEAVARRLIESIPDRKGSSLHWIEYVVSIQNLAVEKGLARDWSIDSLLAAELQDGELRAALLAWAKAEPNDKEQCAITLARKAEAHFCPTLRWREKSADEHLAVEIFAMVLLRPGEPSQGAWRRFGLQHRVGVVRDAVQQWKGNPHLLVPLVRLLKRLLFNELRCVSEGTSPLKVCRQHIYLIHPLVAEWNLRGTINKDLATIATRALCSCRTYCERTGNAEEYRSLLYTVLYALPETAILKDMGQYAQNEQVEKDLGLLREFLDAPEDNMDLRSASHSRFLESIWGGGTSGAAGLRGLLAALRREEGKRTVALSPDEKAALRWLARQKAGVETVAAAGVVTSPSPDYRRELEREIETRAESVVREVSGTVDRLATHERGIRDISDDPDSITDAMRRALDAMEKLRQLCRGALPFMERDLVTVALANERTALEGRAAMLTGVFDAEDEDLAARIAHEEEKEHVTEGDRRLVVRWMLDRFMLKELNRGRNRVLKWLLDRRFVFAWIAIPFLLCILLRGVLYAAARAAGIPPGQVLAQWQWLTGLPFLLLLVANGVLLWAYAKGGERVPGGMSRASLLLPQMVGGLFLGIMHSLSSDEFWALGFMGHRAMWLANTGIFLGASYFFVRHVMFRDQLGRQPPADRNPLLAKRTWNVLAIGHWQAFFLITLFSLLSGNVMGGSGRAGLESAGLDHFSQTAGLMLPHVITIAPCLPGWGGLPGVVRGAEWLCLRIYPWAILTWTVRLFFFSAVFERVISRSSE